MSRRCDIFEDKKIMFGNNVSHAKNRTNRKFIPNIQRIRLFSDVLSEKIRFDASTKAIRTVDFKGGLDVFLKKTANRKLTKKALDVKKRILKKEAKDAKKEAPAV